MTHVSENLGSIPITSDLFVMGSSHSKMVRFLCMNRGALIGLNKTSLWQKPVLEQHVASMFKSNHRVGSVELDQVR